MDEGQTGTVLPSQPFQAWSGDYVILMSSDRDHGSLRMVDWSPQITNAIFLFTRVLLLTVIPMKFLAVQ